ncbi:hypothetical protein ACIPQA_12610 [Streptomyces sp. NPDC090109]|uniref:hypothetical protein n=1 Tax=Streptomyces sp. NPDC090109 TaxID=3365948 RepID=UPI00381250D3
MTPVTQSFPIGSIVLYMGNRANVIGRTAEGDVDIRMLNTGSELSVPPDRLSPLAPSTLPETSRTGVVFGVGAAGLLVLATVYGLFSPDTSKPEATTPHTSPTIEAPALPSEELPTTAAEPSPGATVPSTAPSYGAGVPPWVKRLQGVKAAYIQPGNPEEADPADRRDSIQIEYTGGDASRHCIAARILAGAEYGVIAMTPTGVAVDSNDCLGVNLDTP